MNAITRKKFVGSVVIGLLFLTGRVLHKSLNRSPEEPNVVMSPLSMAPRVLPNPTHTGR